MSTLPDNSCSQASSIHLMPSTTLGGEFWRSRVTTSVTLVGVHHRPIAFFRFSSLNDLHYAGGFKLRAQALGLRCLRRHVLTKRFKPYFSRFTTSGERLPLGTTWHHRAPHRAPLSTTEHRVPPSTTEHYRAPPSTTLQPPGNHRARRLTPPD